MIIAMKTKSFTSGFMPVYGDGCLNLAEKEAYIARFNKKSVIMKLVPDDFDFGTPCEVEQPPIDAALKNARQEAVMDIIAALNKF